MNIIDRKNRADCVQELLDAARQAKGTAIIQSGSKTSLDLSRAKLDEVMNYLAGDGID